MTDIVMRLKSGREFRFKCEEYTIKTFKLDGTLSEFSYKGGVGECPIYFQEHDIECIAVIGKEQNDDNQNGTSGMTQEEIIRCKDCKFYKSGDCIGTCDIHELSIVGIDDFCSFAERKEQ